MVKLLRLGEGLIMKYNTGKKMKRLVILSCSQRKVQGKSLMYAMDRYDGPASRCLDRSGLSMTRR